MTWVLLALLLQAGSVPVPAPAEPVQQAEPAGGLIIGSDDVLEIQVFQVPDLNRTVRVDQKGFVSLPLLGAVKAEGMTPPEFERSLANRLGEKYLNNPNVSVFVREYKSRPVSVLGAVKLPGLYHLPGPRGLIEVLAMAQGLADSPNAKAGSRILVTRGSSHSQAGRTEEVPVLAVLHNDAAVAALMVWPGDQVRVLPADVIYVLGDVERPGGYPLETHQNVNVLQALALAGGPKRTAKMKQVAIYRSDASGARVEIPIRLTGRLSGPDADRVLAANDILFVPGSVTKRAFSRALDVSLATASGVVIWRR
jgi:polysaccharide biosynthesis/export protein